MALKKIRSFFARQAGASSALLRSREPRVIFFLPCSPHPPHPPLALLIRGLTCHFPRLLLTYLSLFLPLFRFVSRPPMREKLKGNSFLCPLSHAHKKGAAKRTYYRLNARSSSYHYLGSLQQGRGRRRHPREISDTGRDMPRPLGPPSPTTGTKNPRSSSFPWGT